MAEADSLKALDTPRARHQALFAAFIYLSCSRVHNLAHHHLCELLDAARRPREDAFDGHKWSTTSYVRKLAWKHYVPGW
ncbi:hypothetical protein V8D89_014374 [Ganoderma adspersum]